MTYRSVKASPGLPVAIAVTLIWAASPAPSSAAAGLKVGDCVTVRQQPGPAQILVVTPGGYFVQAEGKKPGEALNWQQDDVQPGPCPSAASKAVLAARATACFASDADSNGATDGERYFRALVRPLFERPAAAGQDGAVTIRFESFQIGPPHDWTTGFNWAADQTKPVYDLRVGFTICRDYRASIETSQQVRYFSCFTDPFQVFGCRNAGPTGDTPDKNQKYTKG
jgi:hypothetical protein